MQVTRCVGLVGFVVVRWLSAVCGSRLLLLTAALNLAGIPLAAVGAEPAAWRSPLAGGLDLLAWAWALLGALAAGRWLWSPELGVPARPRGSAPARRGSGRSPTAPALAVAAGSPSMTAPVAVSASIFARGRSPFGSLLRGRYPACDTCRAPAITDQTSRIADQLSALPEPYLERPPAPPFRRHALPSITREDKVVDLHP